MRSRWTAFAVAFVVACAEEPVPAPAPSVTVEQIDVHVAWPSEAMDEVARTALPAEGRAAIDRASMPILVVTRPELLAATTMVVRDRFYAQSAARQDLTVSVHGTRTAHRYPGIAAARGANQVRGHDAWVTQNEGIWSAAWTEGGVGYSLEVECFDRADVRCADDKYLLELATELRFVGPQFPPHGEAPR